MECAELRRNKVMYPIVKSIRAIAVNGRLRCANRPYIKALIACFEPLPLSTSRTVDRYIGRGSSPIPP